MIGIERLQRKPVERMKFEIVERKGLGHPDHLIDALCETLSRELSEYYLKKFNSILHHNVDKGLIVGGEASPNFGGGKVLKPIEVYIAGRATYDAGNQEEVLDISYKGVKSYIRNNFRYLDPDEHMNIHILLRRGASELASLMKQKRIPLSNDTSFGVSYYPYSLLEELVLETEKYLNSKKVKQEYPFIGEDIKVAGLRMVNKIKLTIAAAIVDRHIKNISEYKEAKKTIKSIVKELISDKIKEKKYQVSIYVNTADNLRKKDIYLTVTGTSAEMGDDANTGRGNRVNGLITPNRFMSLEAVAGKNPVNHVGKIYNVLAFKLSKEIYLNLEEYLEEVYVRILSRIGEEITKPQIVNVMYVPKKGINENLIKRAIKEIISTNITPDTFKEMTRDILDGKYMLF